MLFLGMDKESVSSSRTLNIYLFRYLLNESNAPIVLLSSEMLFCVVSKIYRKDLWLISKRKYGSIMSLSKHRFWAICLLRIPLNQDLLSSTVSGAPSVLFLLDISAACDMLEHKTLLEWARSLFGPSDTILDWIRSCLLDRQQHISTNGVHSPSIKPTIQKTCFRGRYSIIFFSPYLQHHLVISSKASESLIINMLMIFSLTLPLTGVLRMDSSSCRFMEMW